MIIKISSTAFKSSNSSISSIIIYKGKPSTINQLYLIISLIICQVFLFLCVTPHPPLLSDRAPLQISSELSKTRFAVNYSCIWRHSKSNCTVILFPGWLVLSSWFFQENHFLLLFDNRRVFYTRFYFEKLFKLLYS